MGGPCILLASRRRSLGGGCHRSPIGPFHNFLRTNIYDALLKYCCEEGVKETPGDADYSGNAPKGAFSLITQVGPWSPLLPKETCALPFGRWMPCPSIDNGQYSSKITEINPMIAEPAPAARTPKKVMPPLVPGSVLRRVVIITGEVLESIPGSEERVSANVVA